jgi:hypothetical protein
MNRSFSASVWQQSEWFISQCIDVDVASQGQTEEEALESLRDALELHFTPPVATVATQASMVEIEVADIRQRLTL